MTMGPQVVNFQKEFAEICGVSHAFAVTNCTTAMHLCTQLMDIKPGDEVIVTPTTFVATSLAIVKEGATPVYADIDPRTFNIDPEKVKDKVTDKTKGIYVVHYGGQMCDMDPIMEIARESGILVLEDCAHAHGAEYKGRRAGSIGDVGCFSFHSLKNINTAGEGGMITTNRDEWATPIEALRCMNMFLSDWDPDRTEWTFGEHKLSKQQGDYWLPSHFDVTDYLGHWGNNYRMNEIQAAVGRAQLEKLPGLNERRREIGRQITDGISGIKGVTPVYESPDCRHVYHLYTVCIEEEELGAGRDEFLRVLYREEGIQGILHYQPTYHLTGFRKLGLDNERNRCPNAEKFFYKREFNLPMHPRLSEEEINMIIQGIRNTAKKVAR
jgi:perosamine synthetase